MSTGPWAEAEAQSYGVCLFLVSGSNKSFSDCSGMGLPPSCAAAARVCSQAVKYKNHRVSKIKNEIKKMTSCFTFREKIEHNESFLYQAVHSRIAWTRA